MIAFKSKFTITYRSGDGTPQSPAIVSVGETTPPSRVTIQNVNNGENGQFCDGGSMWVAQGYWQNWSVTTGGITTIGSSFIDTHVAPLSPYCA